MILEKEIEVVNDDLFESIKPYRIYHYAKKEEYLEKLDPYSIDLHTYNGPNLPESYIIGTGKEDKVKVVINNNGSEWFFDQQEYCRTTYDEWISSPELSNQGSVPVGIGWSGAPYRYAFVYDLVVSLAGRDYYDLEEGKKLYNFLTQKGFKVYYDPFHSELEKYDPDSELFEQIQKSLYSAKCRYGLVFLTWNFITDFDIEDSNRLPWRVLEVQSLIDQSMDKRANNIITIRNGIIKTENFKDEYLKQLYGLGLLQPLVDFDLTQDSIDSICDKVADILAKEPESPF